MILKVKKSIYILTIFLLVPIYNFGQEKKPKVVLVLSGGGASGFAHIGVLKALEEKGIPIEIYAFSKDKRWLNYEYIMSDIFDHVLASVKYFELEIYEMPSGKNNFSEA